MPKQLSDVRSACLVFLTCLSLISRNGLKCNYSSSVIDKSVTTVGLTSDSSFVVAAVAAAAASAAAAVHLWCSIMCLQTCACVCLCVKKRCYSVAVSASVCLFVCLSSFPMECGFICLKLFECRILCCPDDVYLSACACASVCLNVRPTVWVCE